MKKILNKFISIFIITCIVFINNINISNANNWNTKNKIETIENNTIIETKWIKSYIVKTSIKTIASALRNYSDDTLRKLANAVSPDKKTVDSIIKNKNSIANKLDEIASKYDYATTSIRDWIYNALYPYLWHNISWTLSRLLDLALL